VRFDLLLARRLLVTAPWRWLNDGAGSEAPAAHDLGQDTQRDLVGRPSPNRQPGGAADPIHLGRWQPTADQAIPHVLLAPLACHQTDVGDAKPQGPL
jgi:hypothetical protein